MGMIIDGEEIDKIFREIDKCQILCISCHHKVTDIETKLGFKRLKQTLTYNLNQGKITSEEYEKQIQIYQDLYEEKMKNIYERLKLVSCK